MSAPPRMSILLPLQDEREAGVECARAWTIGQTARPESYEVIVLAPGENPELERSVKPLLRDHDRWIMRPGRDEYELFDLGAADARGEFLFLTEAHCVPEPDCVTAMLAELDRTGAPGVRGASVPEVHGWLGALELEAFEEAQRAEEDPNHWRKVLIHSLAIRRDAFLEAGGTPSRYGDFCTWVLAIALYERGIRIEFSPRPRVRHTYDGDLEHVDPFVRSFRRGEVLYRTERSAEATEPYMDWAPEWERRLEYTRSGARRGLRAALALRHPGVLGVAVRHATTALVGPRAASASARLRAAASARRLRTAGDPGDRRDAFREFWGLTSRRGLLEGISETNPGPADPPPARERLDLTGSLAGRALGFHDPESIDGELPFRWIEPLALLRLAVPGSERMRARLELRPFERPRRALRPRPRVAVDGRAVPTIVSKEALEFRIDPGERWIAIACWPLHPRRYGVDDSRALGVPVRSLSFEPA